MRRIFGICAAAMLVALPARALPSAYTVERVATLSFPVGMQSTGDGRLLFVNERAGRIRIIRDGKLDPKPFATVSTNTTGEAGLLGLAIDPNFDKGQRWIYVFHALHDNSADRVERINTDGRRQVLMSRLASGAAYHHGGIITFGKDGKLYVTNGEAHVASRAQNPHVLGGKIYRINPDGSVPADDPFYPSPVWSYGHRNPFGLAVDPVNGRLWESENGPENHDEVNLIARGRNYGWPVVRGSAHRSGFTDPARDFTQIVVPTGMAFFEGSLFLGTYGQAAIHRFDLNTARTAIARDSIFLSGKNVVGMTSSPSGLYFATPTAVYRIHRKAVAQPSATASPIRAGTTIPTVAPRAEPAGGSSSVNTTGAIAALVIGTLLVALLLLLKRRG